MVNYLAKLIKIYNIRALRWDFLTKIYEKFRDIRWIAFLSLPVEVRRPNAREPKKVSRGVRYPAGRSVKRSSVPVGEGSCEFSNFYCYNGEFEN